MDLFRTTTNTGGGADWIADICGTGADCNVLAVLRIVLCKKMTTAFCFLDAMPRLACRLAMQQAVFMNSPHDSKHPGTHVVIAGAGFAGLNAAKQLAKDDRVRVTLVDEKNHHLFQPLLYQVSMAELGTGDIATPIRAIFRAHSNVEVLMAKVTGIDASERRVQTTAGALDYDYLLVATGSQHSYFGHNEWERHAPGLKTLEQATEIRRRVLLAFERAECCASPEEREEYLTFVVVGGGPTGVELAGAIGEVAHLTLRKDFKHIDSRSARIVLLEGGESILAGFDGKLVERAVNDLRALGVDVRVKNMVTDIRENGVRVGDTWIPARTVLWAAGVSPSSLGRQIGAPCDRGGRVMVEPDLSVPDHPEVFVAGDLAHVEHDSEALPGVAGVALQQGRFIGQAIRREIDGKPRGRFHYKDKGSMATIGHNKAIAQIGRFRFKGYPAWLAWVFVHIWYLSGFRNRVFVMLQWAWAYFTNRRSMRLIMSKDWRFYGKDEGKDEPDSR